MFGEKLNGTDPEDVIKNAFACFDEDASGILVFCSWFNLVKIIDVCLLSVRNVSFEFNVTSFALILTLEKSLEFLMWYFSFCVCLKILFCFEGYINEDRLRDLLMTMGDRFTEDEVNFIPSSRSY